MLEKALVESNILKINENKQPCIDNNLFQNYEQYLKCEETKSEVFKEDKYKSVNIINKISEDELEQVKVKVKHFTNK